MKRPDSVWAWIGVIVIGLFMLWLIFLLLGVFASKSSAETTIRTWTKEGWACHEIAVAGQSATVYCENPSGDPAATSQRWWAEGWECASIYPVGGTPTLSCAKAAGPLPPPPPLPQTPQEAQAMVPLVELSVIESEEPMEAFMRRVRRHHRHAHASNVTCRRGGTRKGQWKVVGAVIGEIRISQHGWCYDGRRITHDFGWHGSSGAWGIYCIDNFDFQKGWDRFPVSRHGKVHASLGISYPFGCLTFTSGTEALRIFGNGRIDAVDDF